MKINNSTRCIYILYNEIVNYVIETGNLLINSKLSITVIKIKTQNCNKYKRFAIT